MIATAPSLPDQIYDALVDEIAEGALAPGTHLIQERLAARFGVSRQPVQQAMTRLRADGVVEELGRRGLFVAKLDAERMRRHYGVRAALDGWSARRAALRCAAEPERRDAVSKDADALFAAAQAAIAAADTILQVRCDQAFHVMLYAASGNPMIASAAEPHWRFLRRAMADVLRQAGGPEQIWRQHEAVAQAVLDGDAVAADRLAVSHVEHAADRLADALREADRNAQRDAERDADAQEGAP